MIVRFHDVNLMISCRSEGKEEKCEGEGKGENSCNLFQLGLQSCKPLLMLIMISDGSIDKNERTVVMDKSKGEPVISVKTKSKERVSNSSTIAFLSSQPARPVHIQLFCQFNIFLCDTFLQSPKSRDHKSSSKERKDILSFDQIKEQRERERQRQREREMREVERRRFR